MINYISDTMALVLTLERRRLPTLAKRIFYEARHGKAEILIPSIVLAELAYLSEKNRIETDLIEVKKLNRRISDHQGVSDVDGYNHS